MWDSETTPSCEARASRAAFCCAQLVRELDAYPVTGDIALSLHAAIDQGDAQGFHIGAGGKFS